MKVLIGAATATLLMVSAALAQTAPTTPTPPATTTAPAAPPTIAPSRCPELPADPSLPDGTTANAAGMQVGNTVYTTWATAYQQVLICRHTEVDDLHATEEARRTEYNSGAQHLNQTTASWVASASAFNARQHTRSHNSGH